MAARDALRHRGQYRLPGQRLNRWRQVEQVRQREFVGFLGGQAGQGAHAGQEQGTAAGGTQEGLPQTACGAAR